MQSGTLGDCPLDATNDVGHASGAVLVENADAHQISGGGNAADIRAVGSDQTRDVRAVTGWITRHRSLG